MTVMLCHECHMRLHDHGEGELRLKQIAQYYWEQTYGTRDEFIIRYGKNFLGGNNDVSGVFEEEGITDNHGRV